MKKKLKRRILIVLLLGCLCTLLLVVTFSKFRSSASINVDQNLAKFIFDAKEQDVLNIPLTAINPGDTKQYNFSITNNKDNRRSNVDILYQLTIETYHFMPLEINLYKGEEKELIINCDESYSRDDTNKLICNSSNQELSHDLDADDLYTLEVNFNEEYNSIDYTDSVDYIDIKIKSWQET